jgi:hypothetical protein
MKIENLNLKKLVLSIADHIGSNRVQFLTENTFKLNNQQIKIKENLVIAEKFAFMFFIE